MENMKFACTGETVGEMWDRTGRDRSTLESDLRNLARRTSGYTAVFSSYFTEMNRESASPVRSKSVTTDDGVEFDIVEVEPSKTPMEAPDFERDFVPSAHAPKPITVILSVWNAMIGSSSLTVAWGFSSSGLIGAITALVVMAVTLWITLRLTIVHRRTYLKEKPSNDFSEVCEAVMDKPGKWIAWAGSVLVLIGAILAYTILIHTSIKSIVNGIALFADAHVADFWNTKVSGVIISACFLPLLLVPRFSFYVKMSSFGVIGMIYVIVFIIVSSITNWAPSEVPRDYGFRPKFFYLAGVLNLGFFPHNLILDELKDVPNDKKAIKYATAGFCLGVGSYTLIGLLGSLALGTGVPQNYIQYYPDNNIYAFTARIALMFQLLCIVPFIFSLTRTHILSIFIGHERAENPPFYIHLIYVVLMLTCSTLVAIFFPNIGDIVRFTGATCGMIYTYGLPVFVDIIARRHLKSLPPARLAADIALFCVGVAVFIGQFCV